VGPERQPRRPDRGCRDIAPTAPERPLTPGITAWHGYTRGDNEHTARAIVLISDLAHIYEGSLDHPFGPCIGEIPPRTEPEPLTPVGHDAVLVPAGEVKNLLVALDIAADYQRDRAELCADCTSQSCLARVHPHRPA